jgi:hypothetical protein
MFSFKSLLFDPEGHPLELPFTRQFFEVTALCNEIVRPGRLVREKGQSP